MRKFLLISILSTLLGSCTKSDDMDFVGSGIDVAMPIAIGVDSNDLTRGTVVESEKDMASFGVYCAHTAQQSWSASTTFEKMNNAQFVYDEISAEWVFTPKASEEQPKWEYTSLTDKYTFCGYSPHSSVESGITPEIINGALQIAYTVPSSYDLQRDLMVATPRRDIYPQVSGKVNLSFKHALSKVSFSVKGDPNSKVISIKLKGIQNSGTLTFSDDGNFTWNNNSATDNFTVSESSGLKDDVTTSGTTSQNITSDNGYLFMLPQDVSGKSVKLTIADSDGSNSKNVTLNMPATQVWEAGESYNYEVVLKKDEAPSFHDIYPDVASCYIISPNTPGEIIIPINEYINYFWSNYGSGCDKEYANVAYNDLRAVTLWYDSSRDPINSVNITSANGGSTTKSNPNGNYPNFTASTSTMVMRVKIDQNIVGNAVIGIRKNGETDYLWSWHLWITDYDPYVRRNGKTYNIDSDNAGTMLTWMDRNLGARDANFHADSEGVLFYQWGRKDPIPAKTSSPTIGTTCAVATIADAVKKPTKLYLCTVSSDYDWCGTGDSWDQDRSYHWRDNKLPTIDENNPSYNPSKIYGDKKSIFDPSPLGFMVPGSTSLDSYVSPFEFMDNSDWCYDDNKKGCIYNSASKTPIFFPASYKHSGKAAVMSEYYVGRICYHWSASPYNEWNSNSTHFDTIQPRSIFYSFRADALPVRSIEE